MKPVANADLSSNVFDGISDEKYQEIISRTRFNVWHDNLVVEMRKADRAMRNARHMLKTGPTPETRYNIWRDNLVVEMRNAARAMRIALHKLNTGPPPEIEQK